MNTRALIAAVLTLVVSWTGTFLHDFDELEFFGFLTEVIVQTHNADDDDDHEHAEIAHHHHHDFDDEAAFHAPEPHEHDPSALGSIINSENAPTLFLAEIPRLTWCSYSISKEQSESYGSQERPPPFKRLPSYLLYHALLI